MLAAVSKIVQRVARADIAFYTLPPLMILLVAGTIAQREIGLVAAQELFFDSPIFFAFAGILTVSLTLKFLFYSRWEKVKSGIILTHLGALTLLWGGLITAIDAQESYLVIPEGERATYMYDYYERRLFVFEDDLLRYEIPAQRLTKGDALPVDLPFTVRVAMFCEHCEIVFAPENAPERKGLAAKMDLKPQEPSKDPEENLTGAILALDGVGSEQGGVYIAFENMPRPIDVDVAGKNYKIVLGRAQRKLPFEVELIDFVREVYPGTQKAKSYHSDVVVHDGVSSWPARIEMNEPLRYKGYTLYQSSFEQSPEVETTILSVVKNKGYVFPYIGTILMALGLILHLVIARRIR